MLTSTRPTPRLSPEEVWETLFSNVHENASSTYKAFYSSELGGIVTEPALMSVAIDDHMVHRGHAVFDTALLVDGYLADVQDDTGDNRGKPDHERVEGFDQGVFVDPEGNIAEGPNMNIGIITHEKELVAPPFEHALAGITMQRVLELAPQLVDEGELTGIAQRPIALAEAQAAAEVFLTSSSLQVMPVVAWDGQAVGEGKAGIATLMLRSLLDQDMNPESGAGMHVEVPYHTLSGAIDY
ncbi:hypothetical protein WJX72_000741 [[Myrmecia] bisecta]|uniref:Uncharacterized protein n=1 Tax=[Myrmecia] bisecta TaxID=41462 RepID=A0AAW1R455_9CHLO